MKIRNSKTIELGKKIRRLRIDAGLTQQQLELAMGASFGSISRIENGDTNPTKETLNAICLSLNLDLASIGTLIGIPMKLPTSDEISIVAEDIQSELDRHFAPAYLLDFRWNIHAWNRLTLKVFHLVDDEVRHEPNRNLLCFFFNPKFRVVERFTQKQYNSLGIELLYQFYHECRLFGEEDWYQDLLERLSSFEMYQELAKRVDKSKAEIYTLATNQFQVDNKKELLDFESLQSAYYKDSRFKVVKYFPKNPVTVRVLKLLSRLIN